MKSILTALLLFFGIGRVAVDAPFSDLPLHLTEPKGNVRGIVVLWSGDGGWSRTLHSFADALAERGYGVVGINSLRYFWYEQAPETMARDTDLIVAHFTDHWHSDRVILSGYSFGADTLPLAWPLMNEQTRAQTVLLALLSPFQRTEFKITFLGMLGIVHGDHDVGAAIDALPASHVLCLTGEGESDMACRQTAPYRVVAVPGGHRYDGNAALIAETLDQAADQNRLP